MLVLTAHCPPPQLNLQSRRLRDAPASMDRGSAVTHEDTIYCISYSSYTIYSYHTDQDEWKEHANCPYRNTALIFINGYLTAVGGRDERDQTTNKVLSRKGGRWEEEVPPMVTARYNHAVMTNKHTVVVAGGEKEESVEVFTGSSWSSVAPLPRYLEHITATLCEDQVYVMDYHSNIYTSSLTTLLSTRPTATPSTHSTWRPLNTPPVWGSTLSTIGSQVVVVGGMRGVTTTKDVHTLINGEWNRIGSMSTGRALPIVVVVNEDKMAVVGDSLTFSFPSSFYSVELLYY